MCVNVRKHLGINIMYVVVDPAELKGALFKSSLFYHKLLQTAGGSVNKKQHFLRDRKKNKKTRSYTKY